MTATDPFLGDSALLPELRRGHVKGNLVQSRSRFVRAHHGDEAVERLAAKLSEEAKGYLLKPPLPGAWVDLWPLVEVDRAILNDIMNGDLQQMQAFGEEIGAYDLSTVYKILFKIGTPGFIIQRVGVAYKTYLRPGEMSARVDDHGALVELSGAVLPRYLCRYGVAGWLTSSLKLSGGENVRVAHTECRHEGAPHCVWRTHWA